MGKDNTQTLKKENNDLKVQLESLKQELQRLQHEMKRQSIDIEKSAQNMAALHVEADNSLNFLGDEYDDLNTICKRH